ncbi:hypothetical protein [uncultured Aquimarina sp.]|uniref:hypothetical protein n=1 Tax=uncultured Aquimarina sp. TaxID=575652 RepID=UPI0026279AAD|nr:hypothetical protein [uncultured Aquimarina sp.]
MFFSCKRASKLEKFEKENSNINRIWLVDKQNEVDSLKSETYIFPTGDSIQNQYKKFANGKLDTLNSYFYEFGELKTVNNKQKVNLEFYSCYDTLKKFNERKIELTIFHKNKDSSYSKTYSPISGYNHFEFDYLDFQNENISGMIWELVQIDTVIDGQEKVRFLENVILVDNKNPSSNPFDLIGWSKK